MDKINMIKSILENNNQDVNVWYLLGTEYKEQGNVNEALNAFTEALKYCDDGLKNKIIEELKNLTLQNSNNVIEINKNKEDDVSEDEEKETIKLTVGGDEKNVVPFEVIKGANKKDKDVVSFKDIGGLDEIKKIINMKIIKPFENPTIFSMFKKKIGGGILLYGPPGCGKTFLAKATAGECGANFVNVHITDILDKYIGESEQNIKNIFSDAKYNKPSILFFDEIDTLGYNRNKLHSEYLRGVIDQFLYEMDGIDSDKDKLLVFGATNMPWDIDSAFKRPGRFDRMVFVPPPDLKAREVIFKLKLEGKPVEDIKWAQIAERTELYSGADIENVVDIASEKVIEEILETGEERPITNKDILEAIKLTNPSTVEWLRTIKNYVTYANQSGIYNDVKEYLKKCKL